MLWDLYNLVKFKNQSPKGNDATKQIHLEELADTRYALRHENETIVINHKLNKDLDRNSQYSSINGFPPFIITNHPVDFIWPRLLFFFYL